MKPQSGKWTGSFTTLRGTTVQISLDLTFSNSGSIQGSFAATPVAGVVWNGPKSGALSVGNYSADGRIHMEEATNPGGYGTATFDGAYTSTGSAGVIRGTVIITKGALQESGELVAVSAGAVAPPSGVTAEAGAAPVSHVWGE